MDKKKRGNFSLETGDKVWLPTTNLKLRCPLKKLGPGYLGPFPGKRKINTVAFELVLPKILNIYPVFHISLLKPTVPNPFPNHPENPSTLLVEGNEEYEVEAVLDCKAKNGQTQFLIQLKGCGPEENLWERASNVHAPQIFSVIQKKSP